MTNESPVKPPVHVQKHFGWACWDQAARQHAGYRALCGEAGDLKRWQLCYVISLWLLTFILVFSLWLTMTIFYEILEPFQCWTKLLWINTSSLLSDIHRRAHRKLQWTLASLHNPRLLLATPTANPLAQTLGLSPFMGLVRSMISFSDTFFTIFKFYEVIQQETEESFSP